MKPTTKLAFFAVGAFLMGVPGLFPGHLRWGFAVFMMVGYVSLIIGTVKSGASKPQSALMLAIATNVSFWLSYALWLFRLKLIGPSPGVGIDPYAGPLALWLLLLPPFLLYEAVIFIKGLAAKHERSTAVIGLVATVFQVLVTLRTAYDLVGGV